MKETKFFKFVERLCFEPVVSTVAGEATVIGFANAAAFAVDDAVLDAPTAVVHDHGADAVSC